MHLPITTKFLLQCSIELVILLSIGHLPPADVVHGIAGLLQEVCGTRVMRLLELGGCGWGGGFGQGCHLDGLGRHVELATSQQLLILHQIIYKSSAV